MTNHTPLPPNTSPPWGMLAKSLVAAVTVALVGLLIWRFSGLIPVLVIAALIAYLLHPLITFVDGRTKLSRGQSVLLVYVLAAAIFLASGVAIGVIAVNQTVELSRRLPDWFAQAIAFAGTVPDLIPEEFAIGPYALDLMPFREQMRAQFDEFFSAQAIYNQVLNLIEPVFSRGGSLAAGLLQSTISVLGLSLTIFVISIYMANDIPRLGALLSDLAHQPGYRHDADRLIAQTTRIWAAYFRGQVILGVIIFFVVSVLLSMLGVTNAVGLGVLSGVMEFLPIIGPVVGTGAAVLVAFFQGSANNLGLGSLEFALVVLVLMFLVQQLENAVLVPRIVGDALDLHPLLVMVSVLMGASLAGLLGAVLAAPVVASFKLYGTYAWRKMFDLPPFPDNEPDEPDPMDAGIPFADRIRAILGRITARIGSLWPDGEKRTDQS